MTTDEARALIAEANSRLTILETARLANTRAEAWNWLWSRTQALVTGYAEALDEIETLQSEVSRLRDVEADLAHDLDQASDIIAGVDPEDAHP